MAYPEPIPALRGKRAKQFIKRLDEFKLNEQQKRIYSDAVQYYKRMRPKKDEKHE
jgi:hypothetical protein